MNKQLDGLYSSIDKLQEITHIQSREMCEKALDYSKDDFNLAIAYIMAKATNEMSDISFDEKVKIIQNELDEQPNTIKIMVLRYSTGCGLASCKKALEYSMGDFDMSIAYLQAKSFAVATPTLSFDERVKNFYDNAMNQVSQDFISNCKINGVTCEIGMKLERNNWQPCVGKIHDIILRRSFIVLTLDCGNDNKIYILKCKSFNGLQGYKITY